LNRSDWHPLDTAAESLQLRAMIEDSRKHLQEAGETYGEHMSFAVTVGLMAIGAGLACLVHAVVPALCKHRCSETVRQLYRLFEDRRELDRVRDEASGATVFAGLTALCVCAVAPLIAAAAGEWWAWAVAGFAFAIPAVFLSTNPQLEPV
jgi:hypothetical protein